MKRIAAKDVKMGQVIKLDPDKGIEYVVTRAVMEGGGTAMFNDYFPDGLHVTIKRLNKDGSYNPDGEERQFYMSGSFIKMVRYLWLTDRTMIRKVWFE